MGNPNYDNCILGAGISGLITLYHLSETTHSRNLIITKSLESQTNKKFQLGPRFLKYSKDTEALLRRLGLPTTTREVFVGWTHNGDIRNFPTTKESPLDVPNFTAFTTTQVTLTKKLLEKCNPKNIIIDEVKSINYKKIVTKKNTYYANHIISTIPLPSLLKILSSPSIVFKAMKEPEETSFYLINEKGKGNFDYVYGTPNVDLWYRKTYIEELDKWVYEVNDKQPYKFEDKLVAENFEGRIYYKTQIISSITLRELGNNINLVGRYGQMNPNIRTEDVIHWAYNYTRKFKRKD